MGWVVHGSEIESEFLWSWDPVYHYLIRVLSFYLGPHLVLMKCVALRLDSISNVENCGQSSVLFAGPAPLLTILNSSFPTLAPPGSP